MGARTTDKPLQQPAPPVARGGAASRPAADTVPSPGRGRQSSPGVVLPKVGDLVGGKYRLTRVLGEGGMSSVWVAHNEALDIQVAVKFIRADLADEAGAPHASRLLREARVVARLGHPAIVRVTDYGETIGGLPYLVMELLEGEPLSVLLASRGRLDPILAGQILLPIAHGLAAAHARNVVHRDVKPENVFLAHAPGGGVQPKLIDFGIVKADRRDAVRLTTVGEMVGTPGYMSPEQARGEDVDVRTDLWGLCVLLYELVTGRLPFDGPNHNALMRAIIEKPAPPIASLGVGDAALWAIVERGLRKDPAQRWQSVRELGTALARWLLAAGVSQDAAGAALETAWKPDRSKADGRDLLAAPPAPTEPSERTSAEIGAAASPVPALAGALPAAGPPRAGTEDAVLLDEPAERPPRSSARRWLVGVGAVALLAACGIAAWKLGLDPSTATPDATAPPSAIVPSGPAAGGVPDEVSTAGAGASGTAPEASATGPDAGSAASAAPKPSAKGPGRGPQRRDRPPPEVRQQPVF